jgi:hypothetical protein
VVEVEVGDRKPVDAVEAHAQEFGVMAERRILGPEAYVEQHPSEVCGEKVRNARVVGEPFRGALLYDHCDLELTDGR